MSEIDIYWLRHRIEDQLDFQVELYELNTDACDILSFENGVQAVLDLLTKNLGVPFKFNRRTVS